MKMKHNPCSTCNRVQDPGDCENKRCKTWQQWFVGRWADLRRRFLGED